MKNFIDYLLEDKNEHKPFDKTIALVSGAYKPPHAGHLDMVQQYAKEADKVVIIISNPQSKRAKRKTCFGTEVTPEMSKQIWELYLKKYGLNNIDVIISQEPSPITAMFKYMDDNLHDVNVIFGVSKKMNADRANSDVNRYRLMHKYVDDYYKDKHILILDPGETAVKPFKAKNGVVISATDIRNNLDKPDVVKTMLPDKLSDEDVEKVIQILSTGKSINESKMFEDAVCIEGSITDELLKNAKIACYDSNVVLKDEDGKNVPVNPKKFPDRAINICVPMDGVPVYIFFDAKKKCWDSSFKMNDDTDGALSPDQFGQFFGTQFYQKLLDKLMKIWPLKDPYHAELYDGVVKKQHILGCPCTMSEATDDEEKDNKEKPKFSPSGRKLVHFNDSGVSSKDAKFFCWPNTEKLYRWSTWKDWKKIRPLCRMRFKHNNGHWYGISLSVIGDDYKNRGFRSFDLTQQPPLQWLSKDENEELMKLQLFNKFIRHCIQKIEKHISMKPEEIYAKINNPEKITVDEIRTTQQKIRNTLNEIIKKRQSDSFKWHK